MTQLAQPAEVDFDKLMAFVFRSVDEVGAALNAGLVVMGDKLGYYRAMAAPARPRPADSPTTPAPPSPMRASGSTRRPRAGSSTTTRRPGATRCLPSRSSPSPTRTARPFCPASSRSPWARCRARRRSSRLARSGAGYGWHEHNHDVHVGCERFFRPGLQRPPRGGGCPPLRCGRQARAGRAGGRHRLRPRSVDGFPAPVNARRAHHDGGPSMLRGWSWRESNPRPSAPIQGFSGGSQRWRLLVPEKPWIGAEGRGFDSRQLHPLSIEGR